MGPPAVVYVVAAVVGVAAVFAFKEYVYEPHIAPTFEAWAEDFLERRRATRSRRASAVPVRTSRRRNSSSDSSPHGSHPQRDRGESERALGPNDLAVDGFELEALASREVDEWRNEVLRSQERTKDGLRKRRTNQPSDNFDGFDSISTTLDGSFTSLTHTPLAPTHVISNLSSPVTPSTVSLPQTPTRRLRSVSQSTTQGDAGTSFIALHSTPSPIHEMPVMSPRVASPGSTVLTPRPPIDDANHLDTNFASPLAIPVSDRHSPVADGVPQPLPFTPTYQVMADDSPFGPLLPDTPRSSAEMYGERPFSPITRVMGSSSGSVSVAGPKGTLSSSVHSVSSSRALGNSGVLRRPSGLANEVVASGSDDGSDEEDHPHTSTFTQANSGPGMDGSGISSLSERYPAPPTPPVIVSPPASSVSIISTPSSPRSGISEVVVLHDAIATGPHSSSRGQTQPSLPLLQLPSALLNPHPTNPASRSQSSTHSATSPALSYASFLSPMTMSRAASESEGDEFLSIASDDSDWNTSPVTPGGRAEPGPVDDRANNPFLDFEHLTHETGRNGSEHGDGSEGSEVLVGQEGGSEAGSDESWGSARRHQTGR